MSVATLSRGPVEVERLELSTFTIPTDEPESDATLEWDSTTAIVVQAHAGGATGLGYTYGDESVADFIDSKLRKVVESADAMAPAAAWASMQGAIRNAGRPGVGAMAVSAVDVALWDVKAHLLGLPLADVLPRFHERAPIYGSGGFTSYSEERIAEQLAGWVDRGIPRVKVKVGREPERDPERLRVARRAVGDSVELLVDANGVYSRKDAIAWARRFHDEWGVTYLEEPVTSEDLEGMRMVRDRTPLNVAAGEYGWTLADLRATADSVDILQADVTRCGGITSMLRVDGMCKERNLPFSAHCAPAISAHVCCAMETLVHIEYFHDHVRVEHELFEGNLEPDGGFLEPARDRPGLGLELRA